MVQFLLVTPRVPLRAGEPSELHQHDFWQLDRLVRGETILETAQGRTPVPEGSVVLVAPHVSHTYRFRKDVTIDTVKFHSALRIPLPRGWWFAPGTGEKGRLLDSFFSEWQGGGRRRLTICSHYLELFLLLCAEQDLRATDPAMDEAMALLAQGKTPEKVAGHFHLTTGHFTERFKKAFGVTPIDWVRRRRIEEAQRLLHFSNEPIEAIARTAGYADVYAFSKAFKRLTLKSPGRFRSLREGQP